MTDRHVGGPCGSAVPGLMPGRASQGCSLKGAFLVTATAVLLALLAPRSSSANESHSKHWGSAFAQLVEPGLYLLSPVRSFPDLLPRYVAVIVASRFVVMGACGSHRLGAACVYDQALFELSC